MNNSWIGCMSALGILKLDAKAGPFCPSLELIVVDTPLTQAICSLEVPTWHILCSSEYLGSKVVHLFRQNKSPSPQNTAVIFTHIIFVYMCGPWLRKGGRETESVCVQSFHSQSRNNFRWRTVRERQISQRYNLFVKSKKMNLFTKQTHREWTYGCQGG